MQVFYEAEHGPLDVYYPEDKSYQPFAYLADYAAASDPVSGHAPCAAPPLPACSGKA